jgi:hypothetical protein
VSRDILHEAERAFRLPQIKNAFACVLRSAALASDNSPSADFSLPEETAISGAAASKFSRRVTLGIGPQVGRAKR